MSAFGTLGAACTALWAHLGRTILTALGIVIGVAAMVAMIAIGDGATQRVAEQMRMFGTDLLLVLPGSSARDGVHLGTGSQPSLTTEDAAVIVERVPGVLLAAPAVTAEIQAVHNGRNWATLVGGVTHDYLVARDWSIAHGRGLSDADDREAAKVALLGVSVAEHLFGERDPLHQIIRLSSAPFTVVGVLNARGQDPASGRDQDDVVLVPLTAAKLRLFGRDDRRAVDLILVKTEQDVQSSTIEGVRQALRASHGLGPLSEDDFVVRDPAAALAVRRSSIRSLTQLLLAVAGVSLVVGGISVMNIMLVATAERRSEIGLRLSIGARPVDILTQFLFEALMICLSGAAVGVAVGSIAALVVAYLSGWPVAIRPEAVLASIGAAAVVGLIFGVYPARRAALLDPAVALRAA